MSTPTKTQLNLIAIPIALVLVLLLLSFFLTGFIVIQPIGALPEGGTIWYWRVGTSLPFIASPDSIAAAATGGVSLIGRASAMGAIAQIIENRRIASLPYMDWMYLRSTGGERYQQRSPE